MASLPAPTRGLSRNSSTRRDLLRRAALGAALLPAAGLPHARRQVALAQGGSSIRVWSNREDRRPALEEIIKGFAADQPNIAVDLQTISFSDYLVSLRSAIAAGNAPDVIGFIEGPMIRDYRDQIVDLSYALDPSTLIQAARDHIEFDGGVWGCPLSSYTIALFLNNSLFEDAGAAPPATWAALFDACLALQGNGITPLMLSGQHGVSLYFLYTLAMSSLLGYEGVRAMQQGQVPLTDPASLAAMQLLLDLAPFSNADHADTDHLTAWDRFVAGEAAMFITDSAQVMATAPSRFTFDLGVIPFPPDGEDKPGATATGFDLIHAVYAKSPVVEAAMAFVVYLASLEAQRIVADRIGLPVHLDATPADPVAKAIVTARRAAADVLTWYDAPATANIYQVGAPTLVQLMRGELTVEDAAEKIQAEAAAPAAEG